MNRPAAPRVLPYRKPTEGRDYWVIDDLLPDAGAIRARCLAKLDWSLGFPHTAETWPGRRAIPALEPAELAEVEARIMHATGRPRLWVEAAPDGKTLNHNCVQAVGARGRRTTAHRLARPVPVCRRAVPQSVGAG